MITTSWISCNKYECTVVQDKLGLGPKLLGNVRDSGKEVSPIRTAG